MTPSRAALEVTLRQTLAQWYSRHVSYEAGDAAGLASAIADALLAAQAPEEPDPAKAPGPITWEQYQADIAKVKEAAWLHEQQALDNLRREFAASARPGRAAGVEASAQVAEAAGCVRDPYLCKPGGAHAEDCPMRIAAAIRSLCRPAGEVTG